MDDLRIEEEVLKELNVKEIGRWIDEVLKKTSLQMFVKTLSRL